ncbi:MAG: tetratricopeptide repeat protein [Flavobacteriaceae bacterium]|nr:tetratricopeptide repeat protein [Flavobacteriaceae bacterium]
MKNILFTLALLVSFSSFGQANILNIKNPNTTKNLNTEEKDEFNPNETAERLSKKEEQNIERFRAAQDRGLSRFDLLDYDGAIVDFTKAIEIIPNIPYPYYYRGLSKANLDDYNGAIRDFTKIIELDLYDHFGWNHGGIPKLYGDVYYERGNIKFILKDYNGALTDFYQAGGIDPSNVYAVLWIGHTKNELKDHNGAIKAFNEVLDIGNAKEFVEDIEYYYTRGIAKFELEDYSGALTEFTKVIALDPNYDYAYAQRARCHYAVNNFQKAIIDSSNAIELNPTYGYYYYLRAWHNHKLGENLNACTDIKKAIELDITIGGYEYDEGFDILAACTQKIDGK